MREESITFTVYGGDSAEIEKRIESRVADYGYRAGARDVSVVASPWTTYQGRVAMWEADVSVVFAR